MTTSKKALVFYPHNFLEMSAGTHRRVFELLTYLKSRGFSTDLLSLDGYTNRWRPEDISRRDLAASISICEWKPSLRKKLNLEMTGRAGRLPDLTTAPLKKMFQDLIRPGGYGFVLISYVYWAALADHVEDSAVKIVDLHDFVTLNNYLLSNKKKFELGGMFEGEIQAISKFDYAFSISEEEKLLLSPFVPDTVFVDVPMSYTGKFRQEKTCDHELLFVGSDNEFNRKGMDWFMQAVYPLLPSDLRIAVIGRICRFVEEKANITFIEYSEDLDRHYIRSKMAICPLKGGTGLKIKVIEALSYGKPVVTTSWGLSGITQKHDNGCLVGDSGKDFAAAIKTLLDDKNEYLRQSKLAEKFFSGRYSTEVVYRNLDGVFLQPRQVR